MVNWSPRNLLIVTVLVAAIVGSVTEISITYLSHTSPSPQTRDFYVFAFDQNFNASAARAITSDYIFLPSTVTVNKGDTVNIHFYNPTDQAHSFTIGAPYSIDVTVQAMTPGNPGVIRSANVTITMNQVGTFAFTCKFHPPQMTGTIIVQA